MKTHAQKSKEALALAGKLATACQNLIASSLCDLSIRLEEMNKALLTYNKYIMDWCIKDSQKLEEE